MGRRRASILNFLAPALLSPGQSLVCVLEKQCGGWRRGLLGSNTAAITSCCETPVPSRTVPEPISSSTAWISKAPHRQY